MMLPSAPSWLGVQKRDMFRLSESHNMLVPTNGPETPFNDPPSWDPQCDLLVIRLITPSQPVIHLSKGLPRTKISHSMNSQVWGLDQTNSSSREYFGRNVQRTFVYCWQSGGYRLKRIGNGGSKENAAFIHRKWDVLIRWVIS